MFEVENVFIEGLLVLKPRVFYDERGYFYESFNAGRFEANGLAVNFVQDNQSLSQRGTVRGLHFQSPPHDQGKLVRVVKGAVLDVVVDIRKNSPTYGKSYSIELREDNFLMFWIPTGFAHGFATLEDHTIFQYKCSNYYNKQSEGGILWNDPDLDIDWRVDNPVISEKDRELPLFQNFNNPF